MAVSSVTFKQFATNNFTSPVKKSEFQKPVEQCEMVTKFCETFKLPDENCNHSVFDEALAQKIASYKDNSIDPITDFLQTAKNEKEITAGLFLLNRTIDAGAKNVEKVYPFISKYNYSNSPNIEVMLSGIYRKTQVPDGFGPLMAMFLKNAENPKTKPFDPNEEIGGAILEYLRNKSAVYNYLN